MLFDNTADKYFIFKPSRNHIGTPKDLGIDFDDLYFKSAPNTTLHGWFINKGSKQTILFDNTADKYFIFKPYRLIFVSPRIYVYSFIIFLFSINMKSTIMCPYDPMNLRSNL